MLSDAVALLSYDSCWSRPMSTKSFTSPAQTLDCTSHEKARYQRLPRPPRWQMAAPQLICLIQRKEYATKRVQRLHLIFTAIY